MSAMMSIFEAALCHLLYELPTSFFCFQCSALGTGLDLGVGWGGQEAFCS